MWVLSAVRSCHCCVLLINLMNACTHADRFLLSHTLLPPLETLSFLHPRRLFSCTTECDEFKWKQRIREYFRCLKIPRTSNCLDFPPPLTAKICRSSHETHKIPSLGVWIVRNFNWMSAIHHSGITGGGSANAPAVGWTDILIGQPQKSTRSARHHSPN